MVQNIERVLLGLTDCKYGGQRVKRRVFNVLCKVFKPSLGRVGRHEFLQKQEQLHIHKHWNFSNKPRRSAAKFFKSSNTKEVDSDGHWDPSLLNGKCKLNWVSYRNFVKQEGLYREFTELYFIVKWVVARAEVVCNLEFFLQLSLVHNDKMSRQWRLQWQLHLT